MCFVFSFIRIFLVLKIPKSESFRKQIEFLIFLQIIICFDTTGLRLKVGLWRPPRKLQKYTSDHCLSIVAPLNCWTIAGWRKTLFNQSVGFILINIKCFKNYATKHRKLIKTNLMSGKWMIIVRNHEIRNKLLLHESDVLSVPVDRLFDLNFLHSFNW